MGKQTNSTNRRSAIMRAAGTALGLLGVAGSAAAADPAPVQVGLIAPTSGLYARFGQVMKMGAELAVDDINRKGGIQSMGGARLKLVVIDSGDSTEKAKSAAQRMVSEYPDLSVATGAYLSSFTLAVTEVTERAKLPMLTLSYSDQITGRGFKYIFQTSATAGRQADIALPSILDLAEKASGKRPQTVAIVTDNTAASLSTVKAMKEGGLLDKYKLKLVVDQTFTPPLSDASSLVQQVRSRKPDLLFFLPTVISDSKLLLEKMNEMNVRIPTIGFGIAIAEPDVLATISPQLLEGVMSAVGNWGAKGQEDLIRRMKEQYKEPWMTQNAISTYGDMWIMKSALEKAGKADREAVATALRGLDEGRSPYFPGGVVKFDELGRRIGATLTVIQWQKGVPVTVFPEENAVAKALWPTGR
ncbi:ABC transporter substrate-binding protein [Xylophilus sp. GOD-11R]|uniref:ABC transporter substrate-binding protein n=1 Tax=Xylophilus sp. GOD-11R TaxID=3089814 RepID=UPI00298C9590|nr:ABC transporter substrate-binding protein [Xylophilus sp. GOD-11R]WPB55512.1 ABC transporter substrate-binding protein [Xylophilus sp. GOD-11R]